MFVVYFLIMAFIRPRNSTQQFADIGKPFSIFIPFVDSFF